MGNSAVVTGANGGARASLLVGRDPELALIAGRLADWEAGAAILVRGPAGIGKTALIDEAVRQAAPSRRVLRTVGNTPETGLAMAGLYQLLQPLLPWAHLIPEPRQAALRVAFGVTLGAPPEPFAVAMATLDLLADAAAEQPLLVVAEDLQWLDPATVGVLRFVGRRLEHDPIVLLATTRDDEPEPFHGAGSVLIDLEPLGADDSRRLLASAAPDLSSAARARVLRVAGGNPLALVELPKTVGLTWRASGGPRGCRSPSVSRPPSRPVSSAFRPPPVPLSPCWPCTTQGRYRNYSTLLARQGHRHI